MVGKAYHAFELWSDWLSGARVEVALIGFGLGIGLGLVIFVSYTVCINHFLVKEVKQPSVRSDFSIKCGSTICD